MASPKKSVIFHAFWEKRSARMRQDWFFEA
jgi:hypothetical protein